jgi:hypothetical protein
MAAAGAVSYPTLAAISNAAGEYDASQRFIREVRARLFTNGGEVLSLATESDVLVHVGVPSKFVPFFPWLAIDAQRAYWTFVGSASGSGSLTTSLLSVPLSGGELTALATQKTALNTDLNIAVVRPIVAGDGRVYWTTLTETTTQGLAQFLVRVPVGGGAVVTLATATSLPSAQAGLAQVDGTLYWTVNSSRIESTLLSVGTNGIARALYSRDYGILGAIAGDETYLYFAESSQLARLSRAGGAPELLSDAPAGDVVALDDESVYWVASTAATFVGPQAPCSTSSCQIMSVPKTGGPTTVISTGRLVWSSWALAVDATSIYAVLASGDNASVLAKITPK